MSYAILIIGCLLIIIAIFLFVKAKKLLEREQNIKINNKTELLEKEKLKEIISELKVIKDSTAKDIHSNNEELQRIKKEVANLEEEKKKQEQELVDHCTKLAKSRDEILEQNKKHSEEAFQTYFEVLEHQYDQIEQDFDDKYDYLIEQNNKRIKILQEKEEQEQAILDEISATRAAAQQAILREKEIKEQQSFYCLSVSDTDLSDIRVLERIKPQLNKPRILSMLIWSTYWQKPMTALCNNIIGTGVHTGIYKITNQNNDMCYIGQAVDLSKRWKDHAKCGLGIDTPAGNKLYKAMIEDGIWNFSWEVLEECEREKLNEKERYYIKLYQSNEFGYNITAGNK